MVMNTSTTGMQSNINFVPPQRGKVLGSPARWMHRHHMVVAQDLLLHEAPARAKAWQIWDKSELLLSGFWSFGGGNPTHWSGAFGPKHATVR